MKARVGIPQGWMNKTERRWLRQQGSLVRTLAAEVGSWRGRSTLAFLSRIQPGVRLYCVDTWSGPPDGDEDAGQASIYVGAGDVFAQFQRNIALAGRASFVVPLRMDSASGALEIMRRHGPASLDFVFVDADHRYEAVLADINAYLPLVRPGGVIAGHDYRATFPGVIQAVGEVFGDRASIAASSIWSAQL